MRFLILSDIHSNWEALEAVLEDAEGLYDVTIACGDFVGYGADPNGTVEWARRQAGTVLRGNHDKACVGIMDLQWFNAAARAAAEWTARVLTVDNRNYLLNLPRGPVPVDGFQALHGSPVDEDEYIIEREDAAAVVSDLDVAVSFFGHTHLQGGFLLHRNGVKELPRLRQGERDRPVQLENDVRYLLNPGSVGQPRDADPRAAYLLYEPLQRLVTFRRVPYDIRKAQAKILAAGLPEVLAMRLEFGR